MSAAPSPASPLPDQSPQAGGAVDRSGPSGKAIIGWSAAMLAVLALVWLVGAVIVPVWRVRRLVTRCHVASLNGGIRNDRMQELMVPLGRQEVVARRISLYLRFPDRVAVHRSIAFSMLAACGKRAVPELVHHLSDARAANRYYAAAALSRFGAVRQPDVVAALITTMQEDPELSTRWVAARSLGSIGDSRATEFLMAVLKDKDTSMRQIAAAALGDIKDSRAAEPLVDALKDEDALTRTYAAIALGKLGDTRALDPLEAALGDKRQWVRQEAVSALGEINNPQAKDLLAAALKDQDPSVRHFATDALKKIRAAEQKGKSE